MGRDDAMWAALTDPNKRGGRWVSEEFFAHGRHEVREHFSKLASLGLTPRPGRALDFGCGPGRLAHALLPSFHEVHAVDVSPEMLASARALTSPDPRLTFHCNQEPDLALFPSDHFSFVISMLVFQHVPPRSTKRYLTEIVRVLEPGGVAVVQIPSERVPSSSPSLRRHLPPALRNTLRRVRAAGKPLMDAHSVPRQVVVDLFEQCGAEVCDMTRDRRAGRDWVSYTYVVRKR